MNPDLRIDGLDSDRPLDLVGLLDQHHEAAIAGLHDDNRADCLTAIVWMSAHLAAVRVSLYPAIAGRSLEGRRATDVQIDIDAELLDALWRLDRHLTGDVTSAGVPTEHIRRSVQDLLAKHIDGEQRLLQSHPLVGTASEQEVTEKLRRAFLAAPTRPHPSMPHHRVLA